MRLAAGTIGVAAGYLVFWGAAGRVEFTAGRRRQSVIASVPTLYQEATLVAVHDRDFDLVHRH